MFDIDRRKFIGGSLIASTAVVGPTALIHFLATPDAPVRVMAILKETAGLNDSHWGVVQEFTKSLLTSATHRESGAAFQAKLLGSGEPGELEYYVVVEFITSTNYTHFLDNPSTKLAMLPAQAKEQMNRGLIA